MNVIARTTGKIMRMAISIRRLAPNKEAIVARLVLPEDRAEFLLREASCSTAFYHPSSQSLIVLAAPGEGTPRTLAWVPPGEGSTPEWIPLGASDSIVFQAFDIGSTWGKNPDFGTIRIARTPSAFEFETVYGPAAFLDEAAGRDDMVAWAEWSEPPRIAAYSKNTGVVTIASGSWYPARFGLGEDRYAWIGATGERAFDGLYETAQLYHCKRTREPTPCEVEEGPVLPIAGSTGPVAVHDRWIAFFGVRDDVWDAFLYDRSTDGLYRVNRYDPEHLLMPLGLTPTELYLKDFSPEEARSTQYFDGLVRYDLERLDEFTTRLN